MLVVKFNFEYAIAAEELTSAFTIELERESFEYAIAALALTSALTMLLDRFSFQ